MDGAGCCAYSADRADQSGRRACGDQSGNDSAYSASASCGHTFGSRTGESCSNV